MDRMFPGQRKPGMESAFSRAAAAAQPDAQRNDESQRSPQGWIFQLRHWPAWLALGVAWLLARLPYRPLLGLGRVIGTGDYLVRRRRWGRAAAQIARCLPDLPRHERRRLVFANAQAYGMGQMERLIGWWWPAPRARRLIHSVTGLEHLQQAQRDGRGVILLALHTTTMDVGATLLRLHHEVDFTYQPAANPVLDWAQRRGRSRADVTPPGQHGVGTLAIEATAVRTMIKRLRAGRVVWYAPDRDFGDKPHVFAPLFGMPAATITATSKYARLTGARVLTVNYWRDPQGGYGLRFGEPLQDFPTASEIDDCRRINAWVEASVREHPDQYRWVHQRFRTRPAGGTAALAK